MKKVLSFITLLACTATAFALTRSIDDFVRNDGQISNQRFQRIEKGFNAQIQRQAPSINDGVPTMSLPNFFADRHLTPDDNLLLKRAPRRVTIDDLMSPKIAFMLNYDMAPDYSSVSMSPDFMSGWEIEMEQIDDNLFDVYMYYTNLPFQMSVDYENQTAEMIMGCIASYQWSDTVRTGSYYTVHDTTEYAILFPENYLLDATIEDMENVQGSIYYDGSVYFPDGFGLYCIDYVKTTTVRYGRETVTYDTIADLATPLWHDTYLMTANAQHDFDYQNGNGNVTHYSNLAFMFQEDDTTAYAWNLWMLGNRGAEFYIHEDGSMAFPKQVVGTDQVDDLASMYPDYDWETYGHNYWTSEDAYGTVTPSTLQWDESTWIRYCKDGDDIFYLSYYPMTNNVLSFTNGERFILGKAQMPTIEVTEGPDTYTFTGVTAEEGVNVYLFTFEGEELSNVVPVSNPVEIERGEQDYEIHLAAIADGYDIGRSTSDPYMASYIIPAKEKEDDSSARFTVPESEVLHGDTLVIPVQLSNDEDILAFQTDIYLPEGFAIVTDESGKYALSPADRISDNHVFETSALDDGGVRVLCYSYMENAITGNEGDLFYISVAVPYDIRGEYEIDLRNSRLTTAGFNELLIPNATGVINVKGFIPGDANKSRTVTITDVVVTAEQILGYNPDPFDFEAADMNGDDLITVTDIMLIVHTIMNPGGRLPRLAPAMPGHDAMSAEDFGISRGETRTVSIALDNEMAYSAFQLDLQLPEGLTASNYRLTARDANHVLDVNTLTDGTERVLCYSPALQTINGNSGAVLTFDVTATASVQGDITVNGIELVTDRLGTIRPDGFTIGVTAMTAVNELNADLRIYAQAHEIIVESPVAQTITLCDVAGRAQRIEVVAGRNVIPAPGAGMYIVSTGDKTAKLMLK